MSLEQAFPQTFALSPELPFWEAPFTWCAPDLGLLDLLWEIQVERMAALQLFRDWTEAMVSDLNNGRASATESGTDAIDCVRFITCMPALHATRAAGQLGACYDWIWAAVAPTHIRGERVNENTYTFISFPHAPRELFRLYLRHIPQFAGAAFYVSYKFGGLDTLTLEVAAGCWHIASDFYHIDRNDDEALDAMRQMVIWAAYQDRPEGQAWASELLIAAERTAAARQRLDVAMTFMTVANRYVDGTPQEWARRALGEGGEMVEHERLQALAVSLEGPDEWRVRREQVLVEIAGLRRQYLAAMRPGESDLEVLELRVSVLHPLIFFLVNWDQFDDILGVLRAWYRAADAEDADGNVLIVIPTQNGGAAYLWPGGSWLTGTGQMTTYDTLQQAVGAALGTYIRGSQGDQDPRIDEAFRFDVVNPRAGSDLEAAMEVHYQFRGLKERLPENWTPRSVVVFPSGAEPVQAVLSKVVGLAAPLEISFARPRPSRPIRRISVWAGGPWHEAFELEAIGHVARRAGWIVDIHQPNEPTREDLRRFYEDHDADVLWVISHGAHDPFAVQGTGLHLPDETLIDLQEITGWSIPKLDRRLLVLNSCSGASAQGRGGLARIGLAQGLVSGWQAVVGHLWPVHWTAGLAFGAALAGQLEFDPTDNAVLAATHIMQEPDRLLNFLEDRFQGCDNMLDRLRRSSEDLSSVTNWGCPVLLT